MSKAKDRSNKLSGIVVMRNIHLMVTAIGNLWAPPDKEVNMLKLVVLQALENIGPNNQSFITLLLL